MEGDAMQPVGHHFPRPNGRSLANKDKKGRLKCVFGIMVSAEDAPAHFHDHRAVTPNQGFKGRLVLL